MNRRFIVIPVMLFIAFVACSKAKGPANGNSVQPNNNLDTLVKMSAIINRTNWLTTSAYGYLVHQAGSDSGIYNLLITASENQNGSTSTISINIYNFNGPATYKINPPLNAATLYVGNIRHAATSGEIVVTSLTPYGLIGTFDFVADTFAVNDGNFNVAQP